MKKPRRFRRALTIAGSDSSGGAGIQADLRTFWALGVFGTSAVTAVTAQNTTAVLAVEPIAADLVAAQITAVLSDIGTDAAKTGMLWNGAIVSAVARVLRAARVENLVVDPVMVSSTGTRLLDEEGVALLRAELLPLARVVTPNTSEAGALAGIEVKSLVDAEEAGRRIVRLGARGAVVTGGHLDGEPVDLLTDGRRIQRFSGRRIPGAGSHGTGCAFSAALAAHLALGVPLEDAVGKAKRWVRAALRSPLTLGAGIPPIRVAVRRSGLRDAGMPSHCPRRVR